LNYYFCW